MNIVKKVYHTTTPDRIQNIIKEGLKINSKPTFQFNNEPWIYLSTIPWGSEELEEFIILKVNLKDISNKHVGWPLVTPTQFEKWENRWQLRVVKDISNEYIEIYDFKSNNKEIYYEENGMIIMRKLTRCFSDKLNMGGTL